MTETGPEIVATARIPHGANPPFGVYVNGTEQQEGVDFVVAGSELRFLRPLQLPRPLGVFKQFLFSMGVNFYNEGDSVDLHYVQGDSSAGHASELRLQRGPSTADSAAHDRS